MANAPQKNALPLPATPRRLMQTRNRVVLTILLLALFGSAARWIYPSLPPLDTLSYGNRVMTSVDDLSTAHKARLQDVADRMLDVYQLLADMRYLDSAGIHKGPRPMDDSLLAAGLDASIVYLYSILPYVDAVDAGQQDFWMGSTFADFRNPEDVEQGRDPFYGDPQDPGFDDPRGPYMRPWDTPLSLLGNHGTVLLYDARRHRIWSIDQEMWESTDPALSELRRQDLPHSRNDNDFRGIPSRGAMAFLHDLAHAYRTLDVLPGDQGEHTGASEWDSGDVDLASLYRQHGWPGAHFDGDAFEVDQARQFCLARIQQRAAEPLNRMARFRLWAEHADSRVAQAQEAVKQALNEDDTWTARFRLFEAEQDRFRTAHSLADAQEEAEQMCPAGDCRLLEADLPLWELAAVEQASDWAEDDFRGRQNDTTDDTAEDRRVHAAELRHTEHAATVYRRAVAACQADAGRRCPGRTFANVAGGAPTLDVLEQRRRLRLDVFELEQHEQELHVVEAWAEQLPETAIKTRSVVEESIGQRKELVSKLRQRIQEEST